MSVNGTRPFSSFIIQGLKALAIGAVAFCILLSFSIFTVHMIYMNRIFPGIHINGYPVGGLTVEEAAVRLTGHFASAGEEIQLGYLDQQVSLSTAELGLSIDAVRSAISAYQFGRNFPKIDWLWKQPFIFSKSVELSPTLVLDHNVAMQLLQGISSEYDALKKEAVLYLEGTRVLAAPGQIGRSLDLDQSFSRIIAAVAANQYTSIDLVVSEDIPQLMDASMFIPDAQAVLDQSFVIALPGDIPSPKKKWTLTPENLAPMLTFESADSTPGTLSPQFKRETLEGLLRSIAEQIDSPPQNPRFIFNDETFELDLYIEGIPGIAVDVDASYDSIQNALAAGKNNVNLSVTTLAPVVANDTSGDDLGITELVHMESSYFYGSDNARIQNIETAANEFLGLLVAPGETFSMASVMRDITLDNGYSEALIIYDGKTIEGVGGGVCQVSTTLFRTAFFAGFPIAERHPHAYRVSYYEKVAGNNRDSNLAGLDATVYIPLVDLKFTNDTPYWLLMEAYVNPAASRITWKFYSTYDGRTMEWRTTGLTNKVEPKKPLYTLNKELDSGEIKQVDWEAEGADVAVNRTVYRSDGSVLFEDTYFTRYAPWRAVYEYGPGTDGIPEQNGE